MKTAVITGASGGLGQALVQEYIRRGYRVFGCDLEKTTATEKLIDTFPESFCFLSMNCGSDESVGTAAMQIAEQVGSVDILINGAAVLPENSAKILEDFDITASLDVFNINTLGPLRVVKALLALIQNSGDKMIVNISSEAGSLGTHFNYTFRYDYCMSKAGVNMQSVILQRYLKPDGVKVLAVHPGWMQTRMGGEGAPTAPEESAKGIAKLAELYCHQLNAGIYFNYDGTPRAW